MQKCKWADCDIERMPFALSYQSYLGHEHETQGGRGTEYDEDRDDQEGGVLLISQHDYGKRVESRLNTYRGPKPDEAEREAKRISCFMIRLDFLDESSECITKSVFAHFRPESGRQMENYLKDRLQSRT